MNNKKQIDYLIVGQGLAGSLLSYLLMQRGQLVHLVDNSHNGASSKVAAGLMNPITGRRFVKSWMIDRLFPFAVKIYQSIEKEFGVQIYREREILRALFSKGEQNNWDERTALDSYVPYMNSEPDTTNAERILNPPFSWGSLPGAGQVDVPLLLDVFKKHFIKLERLTEEAFDYEALQIKEHGIIFKDLEAKKIIFCEGHQARFNPWFKYLPFVPSKGEMLEVELPNQELNEIVKHKSYIAPLPGKKYWIGSTYEWEDLNELPSEKGRSQLLKSLNKMMQVDYKVVNHLAAIRPTVKDRRPFIGSHPQEEKLLIFNGLGTKGTSLGPYWANEFCDYILNGKALNAEVDVSRFFDQ